MPDSIRSRRWNTPLIAGALLLHLAAVLFSVGYYHPDEHYQILEFAGYKLGKTDPSQLVADYDHASRSAFQPAIAWAVATGASAIGISDPFVHVTLLRLLSAVLSFLCIAALAGAVFWQADDRGGLRLFLLLSFFLWFMPILHVRFSGENWSGSFFWIGVAVLLAPRQRVSREAIFVVAGALFGLAFICRFQAGFLILGLGLWLLIERRERLFDLVLLAFGFTALLGLGAVLDHWLYGKWVFAPWNYLGHQIFEGELALHGTEPWWSYPALIVKHGIPPLSLLLLPIAVLFWLLHPRHPVTWSSLIFFIAHSLIPGHKSLRFLFPLVPVIPLMVVLLVAALRSPSSALGRRLAAIRWRPGPVLIGSVIFLNLAQLVFFSVTPANPEIRTQKAVYDEVGPDPTALASMGEDLYHYSQLPPSNFYKPPGLAVHPVSEEGELVSLLASNGTILVAGNGVDPFAFRQDAAESTLLFRSRPDWVRHFNFNRWLDRSPSWQLYRVHRVGAAAQP